MTIENNRQVRVEIDATLVAIFRIALQHNNMNTYTSSLIPKQIPKQKRSTVFKSRGTRQVQERLVSTLENMQVPKCDRNRCPEE